jgi:hypothetical protein
VVLHTLILPTGGRIRDCQKDLRKPGSALLRVAASIFHEIAELKSIREWFVGSGLVYFHHACVFGLLTGLLGFDEKTAQRAYVFCS